MKLITSTVAPESWAAKGGAGTIDYYPLTLSLAVNQPAEIQEKIAEVLDSLRKLQDVEVAVEVRFLAVSEAIFRDVFVSGEKEKSNQEPTASAKSCCEKGKCAKGATLSIDVVRKDVTFLSNIQLFLLMEAIQADMFTNVMQAPKICLLNGHWTEIEIGDHQVYVTGLDISRKDDKLVFQPKTETFFTGLKMALLPVVLPDKRCVRINVNSTETSLDSEKVPLIPIATPVNPKEGTDTAPEPFTQFIQNPKFTTLSVDKTFTLPNGGTALFNVGKRTREFDGGFRPPILADLPYMGRLFTNTGMHKETECVLMLVTARIIVAGQKERPFPPQSRPGMTPAHGELYEQEDPVSYPKKGKDCCVPGAACCKAKECCAVGTACCAPGWTKAKECCAAGTACCAPCSPKAKDGCVPGAACCKASGCCASVTACCAACCEATSACARCVSGNESRVAELLKDYYKACTDGRRAEATELAVQALALDPMCFGKERNAKGR
jgi:general secretion pathway protein D